MCDVCWKQAGSPVEWTPQTARFIELADRLYEDHPTGGPLHVYLDDWNLDRVVEPGYAVLVEDDDAASTREVCDELAGILNAWTPPQRYSAMAYWNGFVEREAAA